MKNPSKPKYHIRDIIVFQDNEILSQGIIKKAWFDAHDVCWKYEVRVSENKFGFTYQENKILYKLS